MDDILSFLEILEVLLYLVIIGTLVFLIIYLFPILRMIFEMIFSQKQHQPQPLPDDWPPEGSMQLMDITEYRNEFAPKSSNGQPNVIKTYHFTSNWGEDDDNVLLLGIEIIQKLCEDHIVLTDIESVCEPSKKQKIASPERFTVRYHRFLQEAYPNISVYMENEQKLYFLSTGFHANAYYTYEEIDTIDDCFFEFYVFHGHIIPEDAKQACLSARDHEYDLKLILSRWPNELEIAFNSHTVDINTIQTVVKEVCEKHDIMLQNPPITHAE